MVMVFCIWRGHSRDSLFLLHNDQVLSLEDSTIGRWHKWWGLNSLKTFFLSYFHLMTGLGLLLAWTWQDCWSGYLAGTFLCVLEFSAWNRCQKRSIQRRPSQKDDSSRVSLPENQEEAGGPFVVLPWISSTFAPATLYWPKSSEAYFKKSWQRLLTFYGKWPISCNYFFFPCCFYLIWYYSTHRGSLYADQILSCIQVLLVAALCSCINSRIFLDSLPMLFTRRPFTTDLQFLELSDYFVFCI